MEREHKKKQEALTLEETKQQIQNFETKLTQLKEEKHQLFNVLKKVSIVLRIKTETLSILVPPSRRQNNDSNMQLPQTGFVRG